MYGPKAFAAADSGADDDLAPPGCSAVSIRVAAWAPTADPSPLRMVDGAVGNGNFSLALALVESVPEQATVAAQYASQRQPEIFSEWKHKIAAENLSALQAAIASAGDDFDPSIGAYFKLIPSDSPEYAQAQSLYSNYQEGVKKRRADLEAKAERDEAAQRAWELEKEKMAHETELAQIEADKVQAQYESEASARAAYADDRKGFWGGLGDRVLGGIDAVTGFVGDLFSGF